MSFDVTKWIGLVTTAMHVAQQIKGASGKDKLDVVLQSLPGLISGLEAGAGDVINDDQVQIALVSMISGIKAFQNAVTAARLIHNKKDA